MDRIAKKKTASWTIHFSPGDRRPRVLSQLMHGVQAVMIGQRPVGAARDAKKWTGTPHGMSRLVGTLMFYPTNATAAGNLDHFHRQGRGRREYLRLGGGRATMPLMLRTDEAARRKLTVPPHVAQTLTGWAVCAVFELRKTPEEVLEAQWSCVNEELRAFTGGLLAE